MLLDTLPTAASVRACCPLGGCQVAPEGTEDAGGGQRQGQDCWSEFTGTQVFGPSAPLSAAPFSGCPVCRKYLQAGLGSGVHGCHFLQETGGAGLGAHGSHPFLGLLWEPLTCPPIRLAREVPSAAGGGGHIRDTEAQRHSGQVEMAVRETYPSSICCWTTGSWFFPPCPSFCLLSYPAHPALSTLHLGPRPGFQEAAQDKEAPSGAAGHRARLPLGLSLLLAPLRGDGSPFPRG